MPWYWKTANNPSAGDVIMYLAGAEQTSSTIYGAVFNVHGIFIYHDYSGIRRYKIRTALRNSDDTDYLETSDYLPSVPVSPDRPFVLISEFDPLIVSIGKGAYVDNKERIEVITLDGGEPNVTVGIYTRGKVLDAGGAKV